MMAQPTGGGYVNIDLVVQALKAIAQADNSVASAIESVFPTTGNIASSAGGATGTYLTILIGGVTYKVALLSP